MKMNKLTIDGNKVMIGYQEIENINYINVSYKDDDLPFQEKAMNDLNLAIYQMRKNNYSLIEIADALRLSDEEVEKINRYNAINHKQLEKEFANEL